MLLQAASPAHHRGEDRCNCMLQSDFCLRRYRHPPPPPPHATAACRLHRTPSPPLQDVVLTYVPLHGLDPLKQFLEWWHLLVFVEGVIYQADEENELAVAGGELPSAGSGAPARLLLPWEPSALLLHCLKGVILPRPHLFLTVCSCRRRRRCRRCRPACHGGGAARARPSVAGRAARAAGGPAVLGAGAAPVLTDAAARGGAPWRPLGHRFLRLQRGRGAPGLGRQVV